MSHPIRWLLHSVSANFRNFGPKRGSRFVHLCVQLTVDSAHDLRELLLDARLSVVVEGVVAEDEQAGGVLHLALIQELAAGTKRVQVPEDLEKSTRHRPRKSR